MWIGLRLHGSVGIEASRTCKSLSAALDWQGYDDENRYGGSSAYGSKVGSRLVEQSLNGDNHVALHSILLMTGRRTLSLNVLGLYVITLKVTYEKELP